MRRIVIVVLSVMVVAACSSSSGSGGKASTGMMRILDVEPKALHQRVPLIIGSAEDVNDADACIQGRA